jgi:hypothetical protein
MRLATAQEQWDHTWGPADFPQDRLPHWFEGMLIPHLVSLLDTTQKEARDSGDVDLTALLLSSVRDCIDDEVHSPIISDLSEKRALIESEKEFRLKEVRAHEEALKEELQRLKDVFSGDWSDYQKVMDSLKSKEALKRNFASHLKEKKDEYDDLSTETSLPQGGTLKRKIVQLMPSDCEDSKGDDFRKARLKTLGDEMKEIGRKQNNLKAEMEVLTELLSRARKGHLSELFGVEEELESISTQLGRVTETAASQIRLQIDMACERLGWIEDDVDLVPTVTPKGLIALLKRHKYLIPGPMLEVEIQTQRWNDFPAPPKLPPPPVHVEVLPSPAQLQPLPLHDEDFGIGGDFLGGFDYFGIRAREAEDAPNPDDEIDRWLA